MARRRVLVTTLLAGTVIGVVARHLRGHDVAHDVPGGVVMGDAGVYAWMSRLLLGTFYKGVADDIAASVTSEAKVLEVGCGPGHLARRLAREHGFDVTGIDLDPAMIQRVHRGKEPRDQVEFQVADVSSLPHPDHTFDVVVSTLSMHHWTDVGAALAEIERVLKPGGRVLIWDLGPGKRPMHGHMPDPAEHLHNSPLRLVGVDPWQWPWRLTLTRRMDLVRAPAEPN